MIHSLPGSLGSDNNNNLMESGNFSFMRKTYQTGKIPTKYQKTSMKKSVASSHSNKPAEPLTMHIQPHIEILNVTQFQSSSHNVREDVKTLSSDSETEYEVMDSEYSESSGDEGDDVDPQG